MDGNSFVRIGKMQSNTVGVELEGDEDLSGILFICSVPGCSDPKSIIQETLGSIFLNTDAAKIFPDPKKIKKDRWFRVVRVTRGFVGTNEEVAVGKGEVLIFEREGSILVVQKESPSALKLHDFLRVTNALNT
jgi:hypothetical protein